MHISLRDLAIFTVVMAVVLGSGTAWVRALIHTLPFPACWSCGAAKIRPSANHSLPETCLKLMFLTPYRCRGCRTRFYGLRSHRPLAEPPAS